MGTKEYFNGMAEMLRHMTSTYINEVRDKIQETGEELEICDPYYDPTDKTGDHNDKAVMVSIIKEEYAYRPTIDAVRVIDTDWDGIKMQFRTKDADSFCEDGKWLYEYELNTEDIINLIDCIDWNDN